jgi:hypothetical protein
MSQGAETGERPMRNVERDQHSSDRKVLNGILYVLGTGIA